MTEHLDLFYLLAQGKLPLTVIDPTVLPNSLTPVLRAFEYAMSKPHFYPMDVAEVEAISCTRFHAKEEAKEFFTQLIKYKPGDAKVESVQQSILLRKIARDVSDQLVTGKYNLSQIGTYTNHVTSVGVESLVRTVSKPGKENALSVNYTTGIDKLDRLLGSIHDELIVVSARPKNGKSNFFANLICLSPKKSFLYVTVADYGYDEFCDVLYDCDPSSVNRKNIWIADFTSFGATVLDVEAVVRKYTPDVVIVDRAEELAPLTRRKETRWEMKEIFKTLRQYAKRYKVPVFVDAQQSEQGDSHASPNSMAEDRTGRFATLDLFVGLQRGQGAVTMAVYGRRKSLPSTISVSTNAMGVYL